jgi:hypothetical protein
MGRNLLDQSNFGANLNPFEINLIQFENQIGRTVLQTPPVSAAPSASPRCPAPHPATDDRPPIASRSTCHATPSRCSTTRQAPLSPSLSPAPPPHGAHPSAPSPPLPFKTEPPPPAKFFSPTHDFPSPLRRRAAATSLASTSSRRTASPPTGACRQHLTAGQPPPGRRRARLLTRGARTHCHAPRGPFSTLGRAARPRPHGYFGRPHVAGRRAPWAVASCWFLAQYCAQGFNCLSIVLNSRNCFKLQNFVEACRNVQNLQTKFRMNPLEPLFTVGLTKLLLCSKFLYKIIRTQMQEYLCKNIYPI